MIAPPSPGCAELAYQQPGFRRGIGARLRDAAEGATEDTIGSAMRPHSDLVLGLSAVGMEMRQEGTAHIGRDNIVRRLLQTHV